MTRTDPHSWKSRRNLQSSNLPTEEKTDNPKPPGPAVFSGIQDENSLDWLDRIADYIAHGGYIEDADQM